MPDTGKLIFICGKMAAGKSTLARQLAAESGAILFSEDELLNQLYPDQVTSLPAYVQYAERIKTCLKPAILGLLQHGATVVLDYPANTIGQRQWMRGLFEQTNASHELHYLDRDDQTCLNQLSQRIAHSDTPRPSDTPETFELMNQYFCPPGDDEQFSVIRQ
ncbi:MAG: AAA family ATPase [Burkholderiaceae bacterium]